LHPLLKVFQESRMRRVVVTGLGIVSPLGLGVEYVWRRLLRSDSGIGAINSFNSADLPCRIAGQVPQGRRMDHHLDIDEWLPPHSHRKMARFSELAIVAATEAVTDSGWLPGNDEDRFATGVCIGSGCGGLGAIHDHAAGLGVAAGDNAAAAFLRSALIHQVAAEVAERFAFQGPRRALSTACASGVHAIGDAARLIMLGDADVMVAGGAEAAVCELGIAGFCAARALSTGFNDTPAQASRPWDKERDGFVMGEGAGVLVLEESGHARKRGAKIYAEVTGYGMSGDGFHITAPPEGHEGAYRAMRAALRNGGLDPCDIQYVNAHGTSTPLGDDLELEAVERLFGDAARGLAMSSTKSATGHLLGAAGAVEAIFSILAIRDNVVPPTLNLDAPSRNSVIDRVAKTAQDRKINAVLSNSFGFGGTNACVVFGAA
jgi:3-oxoacyl-[acyl-carrier-protein] synthase II